MINGLEHIGNIPISTSTLSSLYPEMKAGNQKVRNLELGGKLIRLKKGLYVVNPTVSLVALIHRANCQSYLCDAKLR